jgi:hypothetical protein
MYQGTENRLSAFSVSFKLIALVNNCAQELPCTGDTGSIEKKFAELICHVTKASPSNM